MLKQNELKQIKEELDNCQRPLFLFHDDADGLASFLILYKYKREGQGYPVKARPLVDERFLKKVESFKPDKVFVLDVAGMTEDFADNVKVPIIWVDHHYFKKEDIPQKVKYFNPRKHNPELNYPVTNICYDVIKDEKDLWIAMTGCVGDWFLPKFTDKFKKKYPDLMDKKIKTPEKALYDSKVGVLANIFNNIMKGKQSKTIDSMKILTRIETPYELLNGETPRARFILKHHNKVEKEYKKLLDEALEKNNKSNLLVVTYNYMKISFSSAISNELLYRFPKKIIVVCRKSEDMYHCSFRSAGKYKVRPILEASLVGIDGYGGGHDYACGGSVPVKDFDKFIKNFKKNIKLGL